MIPPLKKVIRASAGTGKTYRLSLEYIGLLLQFHRYGLHFSEILVITFTKKATAEIRERIFSHLHDVIEQNESGRELRQNLQDFFDLRLSENDLDVLRDIYADMLTNKHQVQISTIDSFTNTIFKTIIAPYLGITDFEIKSQIDDHIMDELYRSILEDAEKLAAFRSFFERSELKKINDYEAFIASVIRNRWAFHLIRSTGGRRPLETMYRDIEPLRKNMQDKFAAFSREFQNYLNSDHPSKSAREALKKEYFDLFNNVQPGLPLRDIHAAFAQLIDDEQLLAKHSRLLLDESINIWNGGKLLRKKTDAAQKERLNELLAEARLATADYLFAAQLLPEEKELFTIIDFVVKRYDELKFRDKIFTHDDVSYYTFQYLYDPELSLIDRDYVANSFYEHLSALTRFVLIDEFQDTSIIQYKILLPIIREVVSGAGIKDYGGAIVVGDEKQSIYGWRGGERDLLLNMPRTLHQGEEITLDTSYRSDENIVAFINALFSHPSLHEQLGERNIDWPYSDIRASKQNGAGYVELDLRNYSRGKDGGNKISSEEEAIREFLRHTLAPLLHKQHISVRNTAILARRNKELDAIAAALDELGIRYMQESSNSILDHRAVKPIYTLLRFLVYGDFYDLLCFLRSDAVLLGADELKELLLAYRDAEQKWEVESIVAACRHIPAAAKLSLFLQSIQGIRDPFIIVQRILKEYNITGLFDLESDVKNIDRFLMLIASFLRSNRDYALTLKGFLDFCEDEKESDAFTQVGLEDVDAISLMTIHKAKGLEFDTVFLYWNLSAGGGRSGRQMQAYLEYSDDFSEVGNYLLAFNYDDIVAASSQRRFVQEVQRREAIEELNNFYVALTRAKSNLFVNFTFQKKGGFEKLLKDAGDDKNMSILFAEHMRGLFRQKYEFHPFDENREKGAFGEIVAVAAETAEKSPAASIGDYLDSDRTTLLQPDEERLRLEEHVDFKSVFLESAAVDIGNVAHYYLSFIKRGTEQERRLAKQRTRSFYGGLMPKNKMEALFQDLDRFIDDNGELFAPRWTRIFTEHTLFAPDGREIRIDRFMVNEEAGIIRIIDYKTGHIFEPDQIKTYMETIQALPHVRQRGYAVEGDFIKIELPETALY